MEKKLHIKAIAGHSVKIDAMWYHYGDKIDCYLTPAQFKVYVKGFMDFDIILDEDSSPVSIDKPQNQEGVSQDGTEIRLNKESESKGPRKSTKKTAV